MKGAPQRNRFTLNEWSGAVGDLGILLPMAFALVVVNGFPLERIFFLWGLVYILSGFYFRVPVSVQPLKAMAVIAFTMEYSPQLLSSVAFFYGLLFTILSLTGVISWLQKWFSNALVRGIQLGVGLILSQKAIQIVMENGLFLHLNTPTRAWSFVILGLTVSVIGFFQFRKRIPIILLLILISVGAASASGISLSLELSSGDLFAFSIPEFSFFISALVFLMLPQLPLTLGNAVFAASDTCHHLWGAQAERVNPRQLGLSIGLCNIFIGLLGGFPVCHGAGGMGAHYQFGGKTGGSTIILGFVLVASAFLGSISHFLFYIPVPVLGAMLLFSAWKMMSLIQNLKTKSDYPIAIIVAALSFLTRNLLIALLVGLVVEKAWSWIRNRLLQKTAELSYD